jgi:group I intron endonuclease
MYFYTYKTTNKLNGKFYIGVHKHKTPHDKSYIGSGITLKRAIAKHGIENFQCEILAYHQTHEEAFAHEASIVSDELINTDECYNMVRGGKGGGLTKPFLSEERLAIMRRPKSDEVKQKISKTLMGKSYITEEGRRKLSKLSKGNQHAKGNSHKLTKATKQKMSESRIGIQYSEFTLQKMSENRKGKGTGSRNAMSSVENREKVRRSKIGLKSMYNSEGIRKLAKPGSPKSEELLTLGFSYK